MKQYKVYYTPGSFGNFLGYLIDSYLDKKLLPPPFLASGSSHGWTDALHKTEVYPINLELEYKHFVENKGGIGLTWKPHYFFLYITRGIQ